MRAAALATIAPRPAIPPIATREDLIDALLEAAEIEHAIMCQYLYAGLSLDVAAPALTPAESETVRGFVIDCFLIARQEMEHLGLVSNLLIAVGAPPNFDRPNLPVQAFYYQIALPLALLPFGVEFLRVAEQLERPQPGKQPPLPYYPSVAAIYDRLHDGFTTLGAPGSPTAATLFLGAADPQLDNAAFGAAPGQVWYDITLASVTDLASALAAIDLIRRQGEGATVTDPSSHHARVVRMLGEWAALSPRGRAAALRPVAANPVSSERGDVDTRAHLHPFRDERAVRLAHLGIRAYELMLLMLSRQYGKTDATAADRAMYQAIAFFPLMTTVVRPVGEILTELPAGDGRHCASFTFELDTRIRTYPDRATFHVQLGERLTHLAAGFAEVAALPEVPARLAFVAQNVAYIRDRVLAYVAANP